MSRHCIAALLAAATLIAAPCLLAEDAPKTNATTTPTTRHAPAETSALGGTGITMTGGATPLALAASVDIDATAKKVQKSLVLVEWIYHDENNTRERTGQAIVLSRDTVVVWGAFLSENTPREYVKGIKIRQPGKNFATVKGTLLGRTQNRLFAYIKAEKPLDVPPLDLSNTAPAKLGQRVFSVAMLDKSGGYDTYVGATEIKAIQRRLYSIAGTSVFGLTRANSPVFDSATGALVGITAPPSGEEFFMRTANGISRVELFDEQQSGSFFVIDEVKEFLKNVPEKPFESPRPWTGVGGLNGLEESLRDLYNIKETSGVVVGSVIPGEAAEKAGLRPRDIILAVDGKPFSDSPVADLMTSHFQGVVDKHKPGDTLRLAIMREGKRDEVKVTLGKAPKVNGEYPHVFESKVGVVTRDLSFWDHYERRLAGETRGVVVALVKNGAPASLGQTPLRTGYIVTKVNEQAVESQKQFMDVVKKETDDPDKKEIVFVVMGENNETKVCRVDLSK